MYNLTPEEIETMYSEPFCPDEEMIVFVFPVQNAIGMRSDYDATRMYWGVANPDQYGATIGVGLVKGVSRTAYEIEEWEDVTYGGRTLKGFRAPNHLNPTMIGHLINKDWSRILNGVGYWNRGNPIVVEFDGKGKYRLLRGSADKGWRDCGQ
ncbi:MAG: hypothetical protein FGM32_10830 [Candidatus Kapabacteria bacterium]|nr:hypothetical protein [Candidatus Kapabacteria bacterium]